jgi:hypothetical protein
MRSLQSQSSLVSTPVKVWTLSKIIISFLVFTGIADDGQVDDSRPISFGEFVSAFWALQHQETNSAMESGSKSGMVDMDQSFNGSESPDKTQSLKPPNLAKYDFNPKRVAQLLKEYGAMLPSKDVYCTPDPKVIQFLK